MMQFKPKFLTVTIFIGLISFFVETDRASAQIFDSGYVYIAPTPQLSSYPPLNTGMPLDVLVGYIYLDSIRRGYTHHIDTVISDLTNSDTLKYALKYLYELDDYSPLLFEQYCESTPSPFYYKSSGTMMRAKLMKRIAGILSDTQRTEMICYANIIAHIHVTKIDTVYDSASTAYPNQMVVTCEVVDTIKGHILPSCEDVYGNHHGGISPQSVPNCLQFGYSPQEPLQGSIGDIGYTTATMSDSLGNPWVKLGADYIAFLSIYFVGSDSNYLYYTVAPPKYHTTQGSLYQINGGHVSDPNNDLGLGSNATTSSFISGLRAKIYSITHP